VTAARLALATGTKSLLGCANVSDPTSKSCVRICPRLLSCVVPRSLIDDRLDCSIADQTKYLEPTFSASTKGPAGPKEKTTARAQVVQRWTRRGMTARREGRSWSGDLMSSAPADQTENPNSSAAGRTATAHQHLQGRIRAQHHGTVRKRPQRREHSRSWPLGVPDSSGDSLFSQRLPTGPGPGTALAVTLPSRVSASMGE
jgi:hypothetical protein